MGTITTGIGLISGINTAELIQNLLALEARPKTRLQERIASLQAQQTAMLDINARLLNLKTSAAKFKTDDVFDAATVSSTDEEVLTGSASGRVQPGSFTFIVRRLVASSQLISKGFADTDTTPLGLDSLSFEFGAGRLERDHDLAELNGGAGVARGRIEITDRAGQSGTIDLTDATTLDEVLERINDSTDVAVTAGIEGDHLVITDTSGGGGTLTVADAIGDTTATELGIAGSSATGLITGTDVNFLASSTLLDTLNDGNGVLIRNNSPDLQITARDGSQFDVDLGRRNADIVGTTLLTDLNNGAGVALSPVDDPDIKFIAQDGTEHEVDLFGVTTVQGLIDRVASETSNQIQLSIHADGDKFTVTDTVGGGGSLQVIGAGPNATQTAVDLGILNVAGAPSGTFDGAILANTITDPPALTLGDVIDRINTALDVGEVENGGRIVASIAADGVSIQIDDTTGGGGNLIIEGGPALADDANAAAHLGIFTGPTGIGASTLDGDRLIAGLGTVLVGNLNGGSGIFAEGSATLAPATNLGALFQGSGLTTNGNGASPDIFVQDRSGNTYEIEVDGLTTVQDLIDAFDTATGGKVTLAINGQALEATHNGGGGPNNFQIQDLNGALVASELGIVADLSPPQGNVVTGVDTDPTVSTIIDITNRSGGLTSVDLAGAETMQDVLDLINAAGAGVTVSVNEVGNGLLMTDTTGGTGNLRIEGNGAVELGIGGDVASDTIVGANLQHRYVSEASKLTDLNYGRGVGTGSFRITDGFGATAEVSIGGDAVTLYDVIAEINSRGLAVRARVNDTGDGLLIEEDLGGGGTPFVRIKIESISGSAATDLNIIGESDTVLDGAAVDGSYERVVDLELSDNLSEVVGKINDAGISVSASVLNTGAGSTPYRMNLTSAIAGRRGDLTVDTGGVDIGLTVLSRGEDAKVFFGSDDPEKAFLITSSSNTLENVVNGLTIDLVKASDEAVTISVERDVETIVEAAREIVTTFNDAIGRINQYDFFDVESEERGVLLGNPTASRVREALYRVATGTAEGVQTQYRRLSSVGIRIASGGELSFDEDRFREAYATDPEAVENLFSAFEASAAATEEIAPGVTVQQGSQSVTARGFARLFEDLMEDLTNSIDGTLTRADRNFNDLIELANDRIERIDQRLEARRLQLESEFAGLEVALARLQDQSNALASLNASIGLAGSS